MLAGFFCSNFPPATTEVMKIERSECEKILFVTKRSGNFSEQSSEFYPYELAHRFPCFIVNKWY